MSLLNDPSFFAILLDELKIILGLISYLIGMMLTTFLNSILAIVKTNKVEHIALNWRPVGSSSRSD